MKRVVLLLLLYFTTSVSATECDCSIYPFKPNPPCYSMCVAKLSSGRGIDLSSIKNIDPDVSAAIAVLSKSKDRNAIKFENINGEADLIRAAAYDSRIVYAPADAIDLIIKKVTTAIDGIAKGAEGEEASKHIKTALDLTKEIHANDTGDMSLQRATTQLKAARASAKAENLQEAEQKLREALKMFQDIKRVM